MRAILLVDHGSVRAEANQMLHCVAHLLQSMVGPEVLVRAAHMELAEPLIPEGVEACVEAGATELIVFPYMLSPGKHSTRDIPRIVETASLPYPWLHVRVTSAFGVHVRLAQVIAERAGIEVVSPASDCTRCWSGAGPAGECGDACPSVPSAGIASESERAEPQV